MIDNIQDRNYIIDNIFMRVRNANHIISEGQLNERLMNVAGLDQPITRSVF
jgi:hypothetical protein